MCELLVLQYFFFLLQMRSEFWSVSNYALGGMMDHPQQHVDANIDPLFY